MKTIITTLLIACSVCNLFSQTESTKQKTDYRSEVQNTRKRNLLAGDKIYNEIISLYNKACSEARKGNKQSAVTYLKQSADRGFFEIAKLENNRDLNTIHNHSEWNTIVKTVKRNIDKMESLNKFIKNSSSANSKRSAESKLISDSVNNYLLKHDYNNLCKFAIPEFKNKNSQNIVNKISKLLSDYNVSSFDNLEHTKSYDLSVYKGKFKSNITYNYKLIADRSYNIQIQLIRLDNKLFLEKLICD